VADAFPLFHEAITPLRFIHCENAQDGTVKFYVFPIAFCGKLVYNSHVSTRKGGGKGKIGHKCHNSAIYYNTLCFSFCQASSGAFFPKTGGFVQSLTQGPDEASLARSFDTEPGLQGFLRFSH
jgi:hypothetical protein